MNERDETSRQASGLGDYFDGAAEPFVAGVPVTTDEATTDEPAMTRSEERLQVSTRTEAAGRVRLRKFIVTEDVTTTVTVRREVAELDREPVTEGERDSLPVHQELTEGDYEVILYAERVVVTKHVVPVERIRIARRVVTEDQQVDETLRREQIEAEAHYLP